MITPTQMSGKGFSAAFLLAWLLSRIVIRNYIRPGLVMRGNIHRHQRVVIRSKLVDRAVEECVCRELRSTEVEVFVSGFRRIDRCLCFTDQFAVNIHSLKKRIRLMGEDDVMGDVEGKDRFSAGGIGVGL